MSNLMSQLQKHLDNDNLQDRHASGMSVPAKWLKGDALLKFCYARNCLYSYRLDQYETKCIDSDTARVKLEVVTDVCAAVYGVRDDGLMLRANNPQGEWGVELCGGEPDQNVWIGITGTRKKALRVISELYYLASK